MIGEISLRGALPSVFRGEQSPGSSQVWLAEVSFRRGGRYMIAAESGTGKSSLCAYIYGSRRDYDGTILFDGKDIRGLRIPRWQELRRGSLAYLPQDLGLFPELSAFDNIMLKNNLTGHFSPERVEALLGRLGIAHRRDFPVGKMSVGQQQRVAIIRALAQPFDFLLLDEPVSHLDVNNNRIAASIVEEEASRQGAAVISTSVGNPLLIEKALTLNL